MSQIQKILLVADPSMHRTPAFERAAALARATAAALHISLFEYRETIALAGLVDRKAMHEAREGLLRQRRAWLQQEAEALRQQGVQVTTEAVWAHPLYEGILQHVIEMSPDLVVKDVRHEAVLKRVLFTPLDWHLLRLCPAPLLLVNSIAHAVPRRIIAAVDPFHPGRQPRDFNEQIVKAAMALAIQCDAELHLVHAFDGMAAVAATAPVGMTVLPESLCETLRQSHRDAFQALADAHGVPAERRHFLEGPAATAISDFAAGSGSDVVVLGTARRTALDRLIMGSTAESILDYIPCNVLAVKPAGFSREISALLDKIESH
ncbi:MAG: universal stress protein [Nevskia sp.]|nr:universal stress protein [Nevskia sp.]